MIRPELSSAIMQQLLHTSGNIGRSRLEEEADIVAKKYREYSASIISERVQELYQKYGTSSYSSSEKYYEAVEKCSDAKDNLEKETETANNNFNSEGYRWFGATAASEIQRIITIRGAWTERIYNNGKVSTKEVTEQSNILINVKPWEVLEKYEQTLYYPQNAYLALFTKMPDANGNNYVEPLFYNEETTSYMRINLHEELIFGKEALNEATVNDSVIPSEITNKYQISFPEIFPEESWGTIVGFGVFETKENDSGVPILWGLLEDPKPTTIERVPLFRVGDFKIWIE